MEDLEKLFPNTKEGNRKLLEEFKKEITYQTMEQDLPESDEKTFKDRKEKIEYLKGEILMRMKFSEEAEV